MDGCCEYGNKPLVSIKYCENLGFLSDQQFPKDSAPWG
jgi:hypothetical protein